MAGLEVDTLNAIAHQIIRIVMLSDLAVSLGKVPNRELTLRSSAIISSTLDLRSLSIFPIIGSTQKGQDRGFLSTIKLNTS